MGIDYLLKICAQKDELRKLHKYQNRTICRLRLLVRSLGWLLKALPNLKN